MVKDSVYKNNKLNVIVYFSRPAQTTTAEKLQKNEGEKRSKSIEGFFKPIFVFYSPVLFNRKLKHV